MSVMVERVVRINGEERQRSTIIGEYDNVHQLVIPIVTINPPLLEDAKIELELKFDPPLQVPEGIDEPS